MSDAPRMSQAYPGFCDQSRDRLFSGGPGGTYGICLRPVRGDSSDGVSVRVHPAPGGGYRVSAGNFGERSVPCSAGRWDSSDPTSGWRARWWRRQCRYGADNAGTGMPNPNHGQGSLTARCDRSWLGGRSRSHGLVRRGNGVYLEVWLEIGGAEHGPYRLNKSNNRGDLRSELGLSPGASHGAGTSASPPVLFRPRRWPRRCCSSGAVTSHRFRCCR